MTLRYVNWIISPLRYLGTSIKRLDKIFVNRRHFLALRRVKEVEKCGELEGLSIVDGGADI